MPEKQYFVKRSGKIRGPFDTKKIKELVSTQNVLPSDEISTSEKGPWQAVRLVSELNSKSEFSDNQDTSQSFMKSRYFTIAIGIASLVGTGLVGGLFEYLGGRLAQNAASTADPFQNPQPDVFTEWMNRRDFLKLRAILESEKDGIKFWDLGYWMEAVEGKVIGVENQFRCKYSDNKAGLARDQWGWEFELADNRFTDLDATYKNRGFELYQHDVFEDKEGVTHHQAVWRKNPLYDSFRIGNVATIRSLTSWQAVKLVKEVAASGQTVIQLASLDAIDKDVARALAAFPVKPGSRTWIYLNALKSIDKDAASELAKFQGEKLYLDGLKTIDYDAALEIANFGGNLHLNGLNSIDAKVASALVINHVGTGDLSLLGLTSINKDVAIVLGTFRGDDLILNGLKTIDKDIAKALVECGKGASGHSTNLCLKGLTSIDKDVAQVLAKFRGVVELGQEVAKELAKFQESHIQNKNLSNADSEARSYPGSNSKIDFPKTTTKKTTQTQTEDVKSEHDKKSSNQGVTNEVKILQRARGAYRYIDSNGDGQITADDMLGSPQGKQEKIKDLLKRLDKNGNVAVSLNEFSQDPERSFSDVQRFKDLDSDKDGFLSFSEFVRFHKNRAEAENTAQFKKLDTNADDLLSVEEFGGK